MSRIVVTGGGGFVGRSVIPWLVAAGHDVHLIGRHDGAAPKCTFHHVDLLDRDAAAVLLAISADTMLHLAWYAKPGAFWHAPENLDWIAASLGLVRGFAAAGGRRLVVAGSCAEYDWGYLEPDEGRTPLRPHTLYGTSKLSLYAALIAAAVPLGLSLGWGRIFFPYGPGEAAGRLFSAIVDGVGSGTAVNCTAGWQSRDFMHVDDVGAALAALAVSSVTGAVNIAQGSVVRVRDFATMVARLAGNADLLRLGARPMQTGEPIYMAPRIARLRDEVGFVPSFDLAGGLVDAVARRIDARPR